MADLAGSYDTEAAPNADFGPIPAGEYEAEIIESGKEAISKNDSSKGECLLLVWKITRGDYEGRQVWQRINLWFSGSEKTPGKVVQIANAEFASVREATGVKMPNDSAELHGIPCVIRVAYVADAGYAPKNEVKHVKAADGRPAAGAPANTPAPAQRQTTQNHGPQTTQNGGGKSSPWSKRSAA